MLTKLQDAYAEFEYYFKVFSIPQRIGVAAGLLFNGSQIISAWNDITSVQNFGEVRLICEAASSCTVPIYTLPLRLFIVGVVDLMLFKVWRSWTDKFDKAERITSNEEQETSRIRGAEELIRWAELLEKGHISQKEFDKKKKEILGNEKD
jgi:hypothetical protein